MRELIQEWQFVKAIARLSYYDPVSLNEVSRVINDNQEMRRHFKKGTTPSRVQSVRVKASPYIDVVSDIPRRQMVCLNSKGRRELIDNHQESLLGALDNFYGFNLPLIVEEEGMREGYRIWVNGHYERNPNLQAEMRAKVVAKYGLRCFVDNCDALPHQIETAHIIAHRDMGSFEIDNGRPLCANHHLSFDKGYLRFKDDKFFWGNSVLSDGDFEEVRKKYGEHELTEDDL